MKKPKLIIAAMMLTTVLAISCQRESLERTTVTQSNNAAVTASTTTPSFTANRSASSETCNPGAYAVILESRTLIDGNWEWVWSIQNLNPGNGRNGTAQDLSNWGMPLGSCVDFASVIGAAYSADGANWTSFTPTYQLNPSQPCFAVPVIKFELGTTGTAKSYYRLVLNEYYDQSDVTGFYKSGSASCCTFNYTGIGCGGQVEVEGVEEVVE